MVLERRRDDITILEEVNHLSNTSSKPKSIRKVKKLDLTNPATAGGGVANIEE